MTSVAHLQFRVVWAWSAAGRAIPRRYRSTGSPLIALTLILAALAPSAAGQPRSESVPPSLTLQPGERIAIVGNALGDRMQHHGWLETMLHTQHPQHRLVVRNLAFAGDEVALRMRSKDFGTPDEWLTRVGAGVVFAFFGFNESFRGEAGLPQFKRELEGFLQTTRARNYSGLGPPRVVLFSPITTERHPDRNLTLPEENNANLARYAAAMAEVATDREGVTFVDLFPIAQKLFAEAAHKGSPLTFNGVHLTEAGEARLAEQIFPRLFGGTPAPKIDENLRAAVNAKNAQWHARYRTLDGYNVYGGRSQGAYSAGEGQPKISNFQVMHEELTQRDVLTSNHDLRVWGVTQKRDLGSEERPLPPVTPAPTTKPGPNPDGSHRFLDPEEAIAKMTVQPGLKVNLFASEKQFPELAKPVQMAWDTRGRLWVAVWPNYPLRTPTSKIGDKLLILEDTDADGRADRCITFIDDLDSPTGFQFYKDGVLLVQAPEVWFIRDTDGDDRADFKERVLMGLDSADTHHQANSLTIEPGGAIYLSDGVFHRTQVETALGPVRNNDAAIYRYEPNTGRFETYIAYGFANPHGRVFDYWGNDLVTDGTGNRTFFAAAFSGRLDFPRKHPTLNEFWPHVTRPSATSMILTSRHFPDEFQGHFLNGNVIRYQGFYRVRIEDDGSGLKGIREPDFLSSSDPNFRPVASNTGPDGAVYIADWHSPVISHTLLNHLREPNRGPEYGRVYRVTYEGRPLLTPPKIHGQPIASLLELLKEPENQVREWARLELGKHPASAVTAGLRRWMAGLDATQADYQHQLLEALWVYQWHNVVEPDLLRKLLGSPDPRARVAATRVLCYWRDRIPEALPLLRTQAADEHPRVRLHAVRAASFFSSADAVDIALTAIRSPLDYYLNYTLNETLKQLQPFWREQLHPDSVLLAGAPERIPFLLRTVTTAELLRLPRTDAVLEQIVTRPGLADSARLEALQELGRVRRTSPTVLVLALAEERKDIDVAGVGRVLAAQPAVELRQVRERIATLATAHAGEKMRAHAWAALMVADGSLDRAWTQASASLAGLADLLEGVAVLPDASLRVSAYARVVPLLQQKPASPAEVTLQAAAIRATVGTRQEQAQLFSILAGLIQRGESVLPAAEGLRAMPRAAWSKSASIELVAGLIAWAKKTPSSKRNEPGYLGIVQLAGETMARLPAEDAARLAQELKPLRNNRFIIRAVPEEMRFDMPRIVVEAGRQFIIVFENPDAMPHNLLVVKPGTREKVGVAAMQMSPGQLDSRGRAYTPDTPDVIAGTRLVEPGQSEQIYVVAPATRGTYEYVCTFPGHWVNMRGELVVTYDPDAYRAQGNAAAGSTPASGAGAAEHQHGTK